MSDFTDAKGKSLEQWVSIDKFNGFQTKLDATKIADGANANGQNTTVNDGDRISIRNLGYELFPDGTPDDNADPITSEHVFRLRSGTNIMMRSRNTIMEWYNQQGSKWEVVATGFTTSHKFGYADYNINTDLHSLTYFGNGIDNAKRWNGSTTYLTSPLQLTDLAIQVNSTAGFNATGSVILGGTTIVYTSITPTTFVISASAITASINDGVSQVIEDQPNSPKGNIYLVANNRLFISGIPTVNQAVYFSRYGDATDFVGASLVTDATADSPGIFNLGEGGGAVIGMTMDEQSIYIAKRSILYIVTLTDTLYTLKTLKPFDGKSQTVGAVNRDSFFTGGNGVFFITPDNQILKLSRLANIDYPQASAISNIIKPTVDALDFSLSTGIVYKDKAYIACKSTNDVLYNDTVLVWNITQELWDSPITGWQVGGFSVYNNGTTEDLYFSDAVSANTYKVNVIPIDSIYDVKASWKSKQFNFGLSGQQIQMSNVYVEGYISPNTTLTTILYLDEGGYTKKFTTDLVGTDKNYIYDTTQLNPFGLSKFGVERFGSNPDSSGKQKFRMYLGKDFRIIPFYNAQVEFISEGQNQQWEVINISFKVGKYTKETKQSLYKSFK